MDDARMLTVEETAEMLGMSKHQVYRRINRNDLPATLVRTPTMHYKIPEAAVKAYMNADPTLGSKFNGAAMMLRPAQVAEMIGFTVETVRRMAFGGVLPYVRGSGTRGHLRIPREAVEEYLRTRRR